MQDRIEPNLENFDDLKVTSASPWYRYAAQLLRNLGGCKLGIVAILAAIYLSPDTTGVTTIAIVSIALLALGDEVRSWRHNAKTNIEARASETEP